MGSLCMSPPKTISAKPKVVICNVWLFSFFTLIINRHSICDTEMIEHIFFSKLEVMSQICGTFSSLSGTN